MVFFVLMPYNNIPESKWKDMDSCVKRVMSDGKSKSSAIAICHSSIMGKVSDIKSLTKIEGGEIKMDKDKKIEEKIIKQEEVVVEEKKEEVVTPVVEEKKEEAPVVEEKKEEVIEKKEEPKIKDGDACMMADGKTKGMMKDGKCMPEAKKVEKVEDKKEEVKAPEVTVKVDASEFKEVLKEFSKEFSKMVETISKVEEKISKTVSAEKAAEEKKDAPKEVAKVEVAPKEEVKVEKKSDASAEGAILVKLEEIKKEFENRLKKLEDQPAPSKVVFSKDFGGGKDAEEMTVEKINARLDELKKIMNEDPTKYMKENMADEAISLVKNKKALNKK